MIISHPFQLTNWKTLSNPIPESGHCGPFAHALSSGCSHVREGQAGMWWMAREEERTPGRRHQGWHSSAPLPFCSLHGHSVGGFRHQLELCLEVFQAWFVKYLCQICKLGFLKGVFYEFLHQHSHLRVQVDAPWHLTSVAIFHACDGHEKPDKN